ncbi:hypothetical protein [Paracoccus sp. (in: a-proteobacteria)]|uniref:hypothetical protein n=1 Tax=Paracoccus sp. TaxID=267 RepID=UPI004058318F
MAIHSITTRLGALEALTLPPSPLSLAFAELISALDCHVTCEHDLDDVDLFDVAYGNWVEEADAAQTDLHDVLARMTRLSATCNTDVPLRRMALIVAVLVREGTASAFRRYVARKPEFDAWLAVPGCGPVASRVRHMLAAADKRIALMARLMLYRRDGVDLGADLGAETRADPVPIAA